MKTAYDIILKPVLTEKSYDGIETKKYCFIVAKTASKDEIKRAVESVFGVSVKSVNTVNQLGKMKRQGRTEGRRPSTKKAYVQLKEGSKGIDFFDSLAQ